ncbi:MAG: GNAT family N-acetyltransferase [Myxococcales bacterium]|nr:GNAT family N-acetyltransferase [Myxococcales bacterium]
MSDAWMQKLRDPNPWSAPRPLPQPVTAGDVCVRLYGAGDGPALFEAINDRREALLPWMAWATTDPRCIDDSVFYVERCRRAYEKTDCLDFAMGIFEARSGVVVGGTGFHHIDADTRTGEIGYWIRGSHQSKGLCTRAVGALIGSGLRSAADGGWGLRRVVIYNDVENVASRRVCEKLGLRLEMRLRKDRYYEPSYRDSLGFAVLADEWDFELGRAKPGIGWEPA